VELAFVLSRWQNQFFVEIVEAIRDELDRMSVRSSLHWGGFPRERDDLVYVLIPPHEWFSLERRFHEPTTSQLARSVFVCAEQPGTAFFQDDVALGHLAGAVLDITARSAKAFSRHGLDGVQHFPLGWTPSWAHAPLDDEGLPSADAPRDIDVLHLGIHSPERAFALAAGARWLSQWTCRLLLSDPSHSLHEEAANFVVRERKWDLLRRSRVLLNIHVADRPYFEWLRVVQAISCGCAVVTEHSVGTEPLDTHDILSGRAESLGLLAHALLRDDTRRMYLSRHAYARLKDELPFSRSVATLAESAQAVLVRRRRARSPSDAPLPDLAVAPRTERRRAARTHYPNITDDLDAADLRAAIKDERLELIQLRRTLDRWRWEQEHGEPRLRVDCVSQAYASAAPRVSVVTPLYNHAHHLAAALSSVVRGSFRDVELIVVDDGSADGSGEAVRDFVAANRRVPVMGVSHPVNRGLGHARNTAIDFARGELCFMLDADNTVYPRGLERLVAALDDDPTAEAAYGMLETFAADGPVGLVSFFPWEPDRLRTGNFIDALALWRTDRLRALGGFTTDIRLHGWEDYDLWCRLGDAGGNAGFVPEIIARYRVARHSMLSVTNISARSAISLMIERYPRLMAGVDPPS
jgi:Glycosyl transferase family 2